MKKKVKVELKEYGIKWYVKPSPSDIYRNAIYDTVEHLVKHVAFSEEFLAEKIGLRIVHEMIEDAKKVKKKK